LNLPFKNNNKRHIANPSLTLKILKTNFKLQTNERKMFWIIPGNLDLSVGANGNKILGFLLLG
jgi:hypothetical protein